jgi:hypothetical protein
LVRRLICVQRGGKELEEGSRCPPLVIGIKAHQVWWVDNQASSGGCTVDPCGAYRRVSLAVCCSRRHKLPGMEAVLSPRQPAFWHRHCDIKWRPIEWCR